MPASAASSPAVDTVVFDLGGVLLDWDPRHLYGKLIGDPAELAEFLARVCTSEWHRSHDLGVPILESCRELAREYPGHAQLIMAWAGRGEEMIAGQIDGTVEVLAELSRAGVPCFALSNMEAETFPLRRERFAFMRYFDGCVISGIEGVAKPDPAIFKLLLTRHQLDPARTVFIDDSPGNITTAQQTGLKAIRFADPEQLRGDLRALGLPV
ncbi:MAG: HAD family phosphatase [Actinomycetota bacterium]|nr:HAD family phosphatase [Actinomycetota bacterium]